MKNINRFMTNICSENLAASREFYTTLFNFTVDYDSDWFVHLIAANGQMELGIIKKDSEVVPKSFQQDPQGFYLTFVVDSADEVFELAQQKGLEIVEAPTDTFYGQRRLLLKDPNGVLVDVSAMMG